MKFNYLFAISVFLAIASLGNAWAGQANPKLQHEQAVTKAKFIIAAELRTNADSGEDGILDWQASLSFAATRKGFEIIPRPPRPEAWDISAQFNLTWDKSDRFLNCSVACKSAEALAFFLL